ncbi:MULTISPECIES: hypothetical protein [unclassified Beijerinckia]|uniref:hypothetical protein n=1 Tax=unclassified Beijerinckia TaxID=2638183 RepID=UPI000896A0B1|nr:MULTISPECIES: hypothetical protein [unclassified Beijerinckia]MDH7796385.1 hypothetical protein [Beijerinckia sp. GAS462]SEC42888.1 hypothetical protein SAMN05443249_2668 [Beijerinckia sp. 28-YEA-48]
MVLALLNLLAAIILLVMGIGVSFASFDSWKAWSKLERTMLVLWVPSSFYAVYSLLWQVPT